MIEQVVNVSQTTLVRDLAIWGVHGCGAVLVSLRTGTIVRILEVVAVLAGTHFRKLSETRQESRPPRRVQIRITPHMALPRLYSPGTAEAPL